MFQAVTEHFLGNLSQQLYELSITIISAKHMKELRIKEVQWFYQSDVLSKPLRQDSNRLYNISS